MKQCWAGGLFVLALLALPASSSAAQGQQSSKDNRTGSELRQNYPNPFNPETVIRFGLPTGGRVRIEAFDLLGRLVRTILDETTPAGWHEVRFDAAGLPSGTYVYRLTAGGRQVSRHLTVLR